MVRSQASTLYTPAPRSRFQNPNVARSRLGDLDLGTQESPRVASMAQFAAPDALSDMSRPDQTPNDKPAGELRAREKARDHELVRSAQAGDQDAFAKLVSRHEGRAMRVAWGLVGNREDARDIAQDGFLRVFKSLDRFDFKHEFTTWLYRIVTNLSIDHLRKKRPVFTTGQLAGGEDAPPFELEDEDAPRPSARLESKETASLVRDCIESLPEHFSSVLLLRELEGLPCKDISDIVGATQVTVRWRLHRGRKLFQDEWERRERASNSDKGGSAEELRTAQAASSAASNLGGSASGESQ